MFKEAFELIIFKQLLHLTLVIWKTSKLFENSLWTCADILQWRFLSLYKIFLLFDNTEFNLCRLINPLTPRSDI